MISPTQAVVQETSKGIYRRRADVRADRRTVHGSGSVGNYVSSWSGVQLGSSTAVPYEEDFVNQYALTTRLEQHFWRGPTMWNWV